MIDVFAKIGFMIMLAGVLLLESLPVVGCIVMGVGIISVVPAIVKERSAE